MERTTLSMIASTIASESLSRLLLARLTTLWSTCGFCHGRRRPNRGHCTEIGGKSNSALQKYYLSPSYWFY